MPGVVAFADCGVPVHDARSGICGKGDCQSQPLVFLTIRIQSPSCIFLRGRGVVGRRVKSNESSFCAAPCLSTDVYVFFVTSCFSFLSFPKATSLRSSFFQILCSKSFFAVSGKPKTK